MLKWLLDVLIEMLGNIKKFMWNYCLIADWHIFCHFGDVKDYFHIFSTLADCAYLLYSQLIRIQHL